MTAISSPPAPSRLRELQSKADQGYVLTPEESGELQALAASLLSSIDRERLAVEQEALAALGQCLVKPVSPPERAAAEVSALAALSIHREQPRQHLRIISAPIAGGSPRPTSNRLTSPLHWVTGPRSRQVAAATLAALCGLLVMWGMTRPGPSSTTTSAAPSTQLEAWAAGSASNSIALRNSADVAALSRAEATHPQPEPTAHLVLLSGEVLVSGRKVDTEHVLAEGDVLTTAHGAACFGMAPKIEVCLGEHSTLTLSKLQGTDKALDLTRGVTVARLVKQPAGHTFSILAPGARATAVGTVFAVRAQSADPSTSKTRSASVAVLEGAVAVTGDLADSSAGSTLVTERRELAITDGVAAKPGRLSRKDEAKLWSALGSETWATGERRGVLQFELPSGAAADTQLYVDDTGPWTPSVALSVPQGVHQWRLSGQTEPSVSEVVAGEEVRVALPMPGDADRVRTPGSSESVFPPRTPRELLKVARAALAAGDLRAALASYQRLSALYPRSAEGHGALVTLGQLELQSGQASAARRHFDAYLERGGSLAPEALAGKITALQQLASPGETRKAMRQYVELYPHQPRASQYCKRLGLECPASGTP